MLSTTSSEGAGYQQMGRLIRVNFRAGPAFGTPSPQCMAPECDRECGTRDLLHRELGDDGKPNGNAWHMECWLGMVGL